MPHIQHEPLRELSQALYEAVGVPADQAKIMTDHLVDANLFGHDSHGSIRTPGYLKSLSEGTHKPVGKLNIIRETSTTA
ncbi:TPA: dehydrogenase, partial [Candidatus Latescibacteria bacterium]|nr:dehydrogenase [Candidatus Latescibacterota bacterium]